jgi:hypothetical protein
MSTINSKLLTGNTYPVKDQLRNLGAKWDKYQRGWMVPIDQWDEAMEIMDEAPIPMPRRSIAGGYVSNVYRFNSGEVAYRNKGGRCEDAPCCGCCTI